jgi:hypothetical protein
MLAAGLPMSAVAPSRRNRRPDDVEKNLRGTSRQIGATSTAWLHRNDGSRSLSRRLDCTPKLVGLNFTLLAGVREERPLAIAHGCGKKQVMNEALPWPAGPLAFPGSAFKSFFQIVPRLAGSVVSQSLATNAPATN